MAYTTPHDENLTAEEQLTYVDPTIKLMALVYIPYCTFEYMTTDMG